MIAALTTIAEKIDKLQVDVDELKVKIDHMMPKYW